MSAFTHLGRFSAVIILCVFSSVFAYSGGNGEPNNPYQIGTISDWNDLMTTSADWDKHFIMTADVNLYGIALTPVGNSTNRFTGVFDGNDHVVLNAYINVPTSDYIGLFGFVDTSGRIRNLGVKDVNIAGHHYVGGLIGYNDGNIINCYTIMSISNSDQSHYLGGFVGYNTGDIANCYAIGTIKGAWNPHYVGGFVGGNEGNIIDSYTKVNVNSGQYSYYIGGLVAINSGTLINCYSSGSVVGYYNSFSTGGLVGSNYGGTVTNCYAACTVNNEKNYGSHYSGGLVGYNTVGNSRNGVVTNCYSIGNVNGYYEVGGLIGGNENNSSVSNSYSTGNVNGYLYVGGLLGRNNGNINNSFWNTETSGMTTSEGGIGLSTSQMKTRSIFTNAGWDFTNTWDIIQNNNYPYLRNIPQDIDFTSTAPAEPEIIAEEDMQGIITPANANKLVIIIHGWNGDPADWPADMKNEIQSKVDDSWYVHVWDWKQEASDYATLDTKGTYQGEQLAKAIMESNTSHNWQHVHLIAHSAGFFVLKEAAEILIAKRNAGLFLGNLHLTTLDGFATYASFAPFEPEEKYAEGLDRDRDWADNYYSVDIVPSSLGSTDRNFWHAHNEDLSPVDARINGHSFPHEWYHATITGFYPDTNKPLGNDNVFSDPNIRYGFPRGLEDGEPNWQKSLTISVGNRPPGWIARTKAEVKAIVDFTAIQIRKSTTGLIEALSPVYLHLLTGSPVWARMEPDMSDNANYISFTYQFTGTGNGYLTAYFNQNLILIGDQRFDGNEPQESGKIFVGDIIEQTNLLDFRLDPIDQGQASISISNLVTGTITNKADINSNLAVNFEDFALFAGQWLKADCNEQNEWCQECDIDESGSVDVNDLEYIAANWLWKPAERIKVDLNLTGKVDFVDFSIFASQWMNDCQSPEWCYGSDFDKSGKVDMFDLVVFAENWMKE
jgi:hypothetical protein